MPTNKGIASVVDDDFHTAQLFHEALAENIHEISVFSFTDPIKALEHFTENKEDYALVISDLRMSGLNGLELLKKVKDSNPKVRTILMSAYNFEEHILFFQYMEEGIIDSALDKPITMNILLKTVTDELNAYQSASHQK
jgi:DNA-binding NtrC family response regulator